MLSIVIPTKNRSAFLCRALKFYEMQNCQYDIIIGDSSTSEHLEKNINNVHASSLAVSHLIEESQADGLGGWQTEDFLKNLPDHISTPYICFLADDDLFIIENIAVGIEWLENHSEYSFVCGKGIMFANDEIYPNLRPWNFRFYSQRGFTQESPAERLVSLFADYHVLEYGISRTEQFKERWSKVFDSKVDNLTGELINCGLVVAQGKTHCMENILFCRQAHSHMSSKAITNNKDFDFINFSKTPLNNFIWFYNFIKTGYFIKFLKVLAEYLDEEILSEISNHFFIGQFIKKKRNNDSNIIRIIKKYYLRLLRLHIMYSLTIDHHKEFNLIKSGLKNV